MLHIPVLDYIVNTAMDTSMGHAAFTAYCIYLVVIQNFEYVKSIFICRFKLKYLVEAFKLQLNLKN